MRLLGIRNAPQLIRYAIVDFSEGRCTLVNSGDENLIRKPVNIENVAAHLKWVKDELHRVIRQNPGNDAVALKTPEFQGSKTKITHLKQKCPLNKLFKGHFLKMYSFAQSNKSTQNR